MQKFAKYRLWFGMAAVYNAAWGALVSLWPGKIFEWLGMPASNYPALMQCIGMMVGVYAIGYALIAINPERFGPFVYVGLFGKILGPVGLVFAALLGQLPWRFGWVNVFNDLIWLPAFVPFSILVYRHERDSGEWRGLLKR
jgi:hypothetical protein